MIGEMNDKNKKKAKKLESNVINAVLPNLVWQLVACVERENNILSHAASFAAGTTLEIMSEMMKPQNMIVVG
jgi:hypothetical protein